MCNSVRPHPAVPVSRYQVLTLHIQSVRNTPQLHSFVLGSHIIPFHLTDQGLLLYTLTGGGGRWSNAETSRCPCNSECPTLPLWLISVSCLSSLDTTWYIVIHRHSPHSLAWQNCIFTITHVSVPTQSSHSVWQEIFSINPSLISQTSDSSDTDSPELSKVVWGGSERIRNVEKSKMEKFKSQSNISVNLNWMTS